MNKTLMASNYVIEINYNKTSKSASVRRYELVYVVSPSNALTDILAVLELFLRNSNGQDMVDFDREIENVYIVTARPVVDSLEPLLRTVPILDRTSTSVFRIYKKPTIFR